MEKFFNPKNKRTIFLVTIISIVYLFLVVSSVVNKGNPTTAPVSSIQSDQNQISKDIQKIKIYFETTDYITIERKVEVTVWIKNTSKKQFSGDLSIILSNDEDEIVFKDIINVKNLAAGAKTSANFWIKQDKAEKENLEWNNVIWKE